MKKVVTLLLVAMLGAAQLCARADADNDSARLAAQKHNNHQSRKDARQTRHAARKQAKMMHSKNHKKNAQTAAEIPILDQ